MIYLDSSVLLAYLLDEERAPPEPFWRGHMTSSRLLQYETWNRLHASGHGPSHGDDARRLIDQVDLLELTPEVLARALEPFPVQVRTLDALHLASITFLRAHGLDPTLATYDVRMETAADALGIPTTAP